MLAFQPNSMKKKLVKKEVNLVQQKSEPVLESAGKIIINENTTVSVVEKPVKFVNASLSVDKSWSSLVASLKLNGLDKQLLMNCEFISNMNSQYELALSPNNISLLSTEREKKIQALISEALGKNIKLKINIQQTNGESLTEKNTRQLEVDKNNAEESIQNDKNVQDIIDTFSASINTKSVKPI